MRRYLRLFGINILVFSAIVLLLEVGIRIYGLIINDIPFLSQRSLVSPWFTTQTTGTQPVIREDGLAYFRYRDTPTSEAKKDGEFRIIAVGGSTTANKRAYSIAGIDYPSVLQHLLNEGSGTSPYNVLNAGTEAYSTAHSLVNIAFRLSEYDPDIILLMHNVNDSSVTLYEPGVESDYSNKYLKPYYLDRSIQTTLSVSGFLLQFRILKKLGVPNLLANKAKDRLAYSSGSLQTGTHYFKRNIRMIKAICDSQGISLVLLSQPRLNLKDRVETDVPDDVFRSYNQAIEQVAKENNLPFIDMYSKLAQTETYFVEDGLHYTPEGVRKFAAVVYDDLKPILNIGPSVH